MSDVVENGAIQSFMNLQTQEDNNKPQSSKGFVVRDAPWTAGSGNEKAPDMSSSEDFPSFGAPVTHKTSPWGPKRHGGGKGLLPADMSASC
ncbi:vigilin [Bombina bombina]|uniref:vigilin n=1 Tax=Bombina bombina TaxID=8345 RepID=UPI00235A8F82|nr:vigilin [Bombina bombina]